MTTKHDGGPAFPRPASEDTSSGSIQDGNDLVEAQDGMSLRDYFAAQALGHMRQMDMVHEMAVEDGVADAVMMARICYAFADAMLAERDK